MIVTPGATVDHLAAVIDHREGHVVALCGVDGPAVERDVEDVDPCGSCLRQIDDERLPDELIPEEEPEEDDETDDG